MKILLVEDDEGLLEMLRQVLVSQHYLVECATDGLTGWELAGIFTYDLILLDWMLPRLDGISFCQRLRNQAEANASTYATHPNSNTPVILLTAKDSSAEQIQALDAGADDYLVKPIAPEELLAHVRALLRRGSGSRSPILVWENLSLNPDGCEVTCQNQRLSLTAKEYEVLELLMRNPHRIFSQGYLLEQLWQTELMPTENTVRSHVKSLRQKLKKAGAGDLIETVYGLGYRLRDGTGERIAEIEKPGDGEDGKSNLQYSEHHSIQNPKSPSLPPFLAPIWEKYQGQYRDRLQVILDAIAQLADGKLTPTLQKRAGQEAHTLVGSLGSFNFQQAAQLARELEQCFKSPALERTQTEAMSELATRLGQLIQQVSGDEREVQGTQTEGIPASGSRSAHNPTLERQILIVEDDVALALAIGSEAMQWGLRVEIAASPAAARVQIAKSVPDGILLDLNFPEMEQGGMELLREWSTCYPTTPVIVFTSQEGLEERLAVAQARARMFLQKSLAPRDVVRAIAQVLQSEAPPAARLLIVDDDPAMLTYLQALLLPWGFQIILLNEPQRFWAVLEDSQPDLLILDIEMPDVSGLDLCQVVRNDAQWGNLAILMLSAHQDVETITQVFIAGADDYISKPIMGPELVARITNRLQRHHKRSPYSKTSALAD